MQRSVRAAAIACALVWSATHAAPVAAQTPAGPGSSKIDIKYEPVEDARKAELQPIIDLLKKQQVLERLQQFLSPLKLKRNLTVRTADCGDNRYYLPYKAGGPVTICYQFVRLIEALAPRKDELGAVGPTFVSREATRVGPFVQEVLHDVALAVFDIQQVPVWGDTEAAADNVAAFLMLQFGTDVAMKTILGSAYFLNSLGSSIARGGYTHGYLADIRPTVRQRYYNTLCVAFGSDPVKFGMFRAFNRPLLDTDLPPNRRGHCLEGYDVLHRAFVRIILEPHVNPELLKQVLATKWID